MHKRRASQIQNCISMLQHRCIQCHALCASATHDLADHIADALVVYLGIHFRRSPSALLFHASCLASACMFTHVDLELFFVLGTRQPLPDVTTYCLQASGRISYPSLCNHSSSCIQLHSLSPVAADTTSMNMARACHTCSKVWNAYAQGNML